MGFRALEAKIHHDDRGMSHAQVFQGFQPVTCLFCGRVRGEDAFDSDRIRIALILLGDDSNSGEILSERLHVERKPTVGDSSDAVEDSRRTATEPDGNFSPGREWIDSRVRDGVPLALEFDAGLRPELTKNIDLFFAPSAAVTEVFSEYLVLDGIPARTDTEPEPPAAEYVEGGRLLGDQRGLPLREDEYRACEFKKRRVASEECE